MTVDTPYRGWRYRIARRLYLWSIRLFPDWHEFQFTGPSGEQIRVYGHWDLGGSWPNDWEFNCIYEDDDDGPEPPEEKTLEREEREGN